MNSVQVDLRQYFMPVQPVTLRGPRAAHRPVRRSAARTRGWRRIFLGYSTLIRGYDPNSFEVSECTPQLDGSCPEFDRLFGSRIFVFNAEIRAPLKGLFNGRLDYGPVPVEHLRVLRRRRGVDAGQGPTFRGGPRSWVASVGVGARVNLFGFMIGEFNIARPLNRDGRGWFFVFNLRPGF